MDRNIAKESLGTPEPQVGGRIGLNPGDFVNHRGTVYRIQIQLDFKSLVGIDVESGLSRPLPIPELKKVLTPISASQYVNTDLQAVGDKDWAEAQRRYLAIEPLLGRDVIGEQEVAARAAETGVSSATLYRWIQRYNAYNEVTGLIPQKRGWREGRHRIAPSAEKIIDDVIENYYLAVQRPTAQNAVLEVLRLCNEQGIDPAPSPATVRSRIAGLNERTTLRGRGFKERAKNKYDPVPGKFPNVEYPLQVIQIDHTKLDVIVVDDEHRKPIGRPWITVAIDVYSRMIVGYYLSLDPPSETSVAMCVAHTMLPKEEWLLLHRIEADWPVWGTPEIIHTDNAGEFRSNTFVQACEKYGIENQYRILRQPRYGGHIERLLGTVLKRIHQIPGTTFSNIVDRQGYDSEGNAIMTMAELERHVLTYVCKWYHRKKHDGIGMPPSRKWEIGTFGNGQALGHGMQPRHNNPQRVLLDFMPSFSRTVQRQGVKIEGVYYYDDALRNWIGRTDPKTGNPRELVFRRDQRDISCIWFFDPELELYIRMACAQARPPMSVWEHRKIEAVRKADGADNQRELLTVATELRQQIAESAAKTKSARRFQQRRKEHAKGISPANPRTSDLLAPPLSEPVEPSGFSSGEIEAFEGIE